MSEIEDYEALLETASLRAELEQLRAKLAEAEARLADPSDRIRIAGLERALEAAQTEREAALRENVRAGEAASSERAQRDEVSRRLQDAERMVGELKSAHQSALERAEALKEQGDQLRSEMSKLEDESRDLRKRLSDREGALGRATADVAAAAAVQAQQERQIQELEAAVEARRQELSTMQSMHSAQLASHAEEIEAAQRAASDAARATSENEQLRRQLQALEDDTQARVAEVTDLTTELEVERRRRSQAATELRERIRELEQQLAALTVTLNSARTDLERVAESRAWRYGHRLTKTLKRLAGQRDRTEGAVAAALGRIELLERQVGARPGAAIKASAAPGLDRRPVPLQPGQRAARQPSDESLERVLRVPSVTVIVPIHNAADELRRCLDSLSRNTGPPGRLLLIDDASTDPRVERILGEFRHLENVEMLSNERNLGFTATVNRGLAHSEGDVVVLNSDTEVPPRWLEQLMLAAHEDPSIGTVTAVSNNAGAFSVPEIGVENQLPPGLTRDETGRLIAQTSWRLAPRTPTGNGFCLYIKRDCLEAVGEFNSDRFPRGYGEENDFCLRATQRGWEHAIDDSTWVFHQLAASFQDERPQQMAAGRKAIEALHPDYTKRVREFVASPELAEMHAATQESYAIVSRPGVRVLPRLLFVLHQGGGGVPATNQDLLGSLSDRYDCLALTSDAQALRLWQMDGDALRQIEEWVLPGWQVTDLSRPDHAAVAREVLTSYAIELVHVRHLFKHTLDLPRLASKLGIPLVISFHDYYMSCPTVHLLDNNDVFCGGQCTPGDGVCRIPSPLLSGTPPLKHRWVHEWRASFASVLEHADALMTTSPTTREVYRRSYPQLTNIPFEVVPHGRDLPQADDVAVRPEPGGKIRLVVPGNLDVHKGADMLVALKELDTERRLDLHFLGDVPERYSTLGVNHGRYRRDEFTERAREIAPAFVLIPSITAETYSHSLTEAWAAGVPVLASDIGALRERITEHGGGWLLPVGDPLEAYKRICEIADDPAEYERQLARADLSGVPSVADMAARYDRLYKDVLGRNRAFKNLGVSGPARLTPDGLGLAAFLPLRPEPPPPSASVRILRRMGHPTTAWKVAGRVAVHDDLRELEGADVVLVQRTAIGPDEEGRFLDALRARDIGLVVDLDDDLFALGQSDEVYGQRLDTLRTLLHQSDRVIVTNERLRDALKLPAEKTVIVPNMLDERLWFSPLPEPADTPQNGRPLRLGYMGSRTHEADLEILRPVLERLRSERALDVELAVIGGGPVPAPDWYRPVLGVPIPYEQFVPALRALSREWDIGVAPLLDTDFNAGKSDLKLLELSALGLPVVCSDVPAFGTCVDGETGIRVPNGADAWIEAIVTLAKDAEWRRHLGATARDWVRRERCIEHEGQRWVETLAEAARRS